MPGKGTPIVALEQIHRMNGGTQSQLMRCSDEHYYVVKFQNNPQGVRILANELLASILAKTLGLPVAETAIVDVDAKLICHTAELAIQLERGRIGCCPGLSFGSRYPRISCPIRTIFNHSQSSRPEIHSVQFLTLPISWECSFLTNGSATPMTGKASSFAKVANLSIEL